MICLHQREEPALRVHEGQIKVRKCMHIQTHTQRCFTMDKIIIPRRTFTPFESFYQAFDAENKTIVLNCEPGLLSKTKPETIIHQIK